MKKQWMLCLFMMFSMIFLLFGTSEKKVLAEEQVGRAIMNNDNGTVTISYNNKDNHKMKVGVTKDGQSYYYDLKNGKNSIDLPLNMGNGKYSIRIFKNISGTKYSVVQSTNMELELQDENLVFLQSNVIVDFTLRDKAIKKAESLTKNCKTDQEIAETIYNYVVKNFAYDFDKASSLSSGYIPDIEIVYKNKKGICYDISAIMAAMMRSQGVEVKLVTGYTSNIKGVYHAWNSIYDEKSKKWYTVDATYDIAMYQAKKKYSMKKSYNSYKQIKYQY